MGEEEEEEEDKEEEEKHVVTLFTLFVEQKPKSRSNETRKIIPFTSNGRAGISGTTAHRDSRARQRLAGENIDLRQRSRTPGRYDPCDVTA